MRRVVSVVILAVLVLNCAPTLPQMEYPIIKRERPIVVSERVGDVVDAEEREQFGLFPAIEGFQEARFYHFKEGGYALEITTAEEKLMSVNSWPSAVRLMKDYIDNYERFENYPDSFALKWKIFGYDDLGVPITKYETDGVVSIGHAVSCGCVAGLLTGIGVAAFGVAAVQDYGTSGGDMGGGIGLMMGAIFLTVAATGIAGCVTGFAVHTTDRKNAVETIREMRKPRVVESDLERN
ncbi:MAG: hypothetical protein JSV53_03935 [candidate division WOR-3 bacterium]|nr:MAG: hypothetical protein JSV53_03935 [candidate division WOR-3 bacterium]